MDKLIIRLLRVALLVLLLGSVLGQVAVPMFASEAARTFPEVAYLVVPYSVAGILVIACGQVALLVVWRLLSMIRGGVIFTHRALRWVDVIIVCGAVATVLNAGVWMHLLAVHGGGPGIILWLTASLASGVAFVLLMIVMRGLLELAIVDRTELDEVI
jgi:Protein of unknown function (DUF2975)